MNKPTRGQWKGYAVLCLLLAGVLLFLILRPRHHAPLETADHTPLQEAIDQYGGVIESRAAARKQQWHKSHSQNSYEKTRDTSWKTARQTPVYQRKAPPSHPIDINSADTTELQQLYGIGPTFALRIVKFRNLLGGFARKEQLLEVYGMTEERYNGFVEHVTVDPSKVHRIDINTATVEQLKRHPYLDYYQARAIVDYRNQGNFYRSMDDLKKISLIDPTTLTKIEGYIQFN